MKIKTLNHLWLENTPISQANPKLAEINEIDNFEERGKETLRFLREDWVPPEKPSIPELPEKPEQDGVLRLGLNAEGKLDAPAVHPIGEEQTDRIKQVSQDKLKDAADALIRAFGNNPLFQDEMQSALALRSKLDLPFEELELLLIHFDIEEFRDLLQSKETREAEYKLSHKMISALQGVDRFGPALVRDNEEVEAFEDRRARDNDETPAADEDDQSALLERIENTEDLMGDRLRGYASQAKNQPLDSRRGFAGKLLSRHTVIAAGGAIVGGVLGNRADALLLWLYKNSGVILPVAEAYGRSFMAWFGPIMEAVRQSGGQSYEAFKAAYEKIRPGN